MQKAYSAQLAAGIELAGALQRPELAPLIADQQQYHQKHPVWIRTFTVAQLHTAGPCYPDDVGPPDECPYPGLAAFTPTDSERYYGREKDVEWLIRQLDTQPPRLLIVTGASGSGKSSLVRAGLLPWVRANRSYTLVGGDVLRLNDAPYTQLCAAFGLEADQHLHPEAIPNILVHQNQQRRRLLIIDQFEDLLYPIEPDAITANSIEQERVQALALLRILRRNDAFPITLIVVVRSEMRAALKSVDLAVPDQMTRVLDRLTDDGLRMAIVRPAEDMGVEVDDKLVEAIIREARDIVSPLPLIQVALESLWGTMRRHQLTLVNYKERIGTLSNAIRKRADNVFAELSVEDGQLARNIIIRLVDLRENGGDVRRPQRLSQLSTASSSEPQMNRVLKCLFGAKLIVADEFRNTIWVELVHEALISNWSMLRDEWLNPVVRDGGIQVRRCELERRAWERQVDDWKQSHGRQLLTDPEQIRRARAWEQGCGQELGPVPDLGELVVASQERLATMRRRGWALTIFLFAFAIVSLCLIMLYVEPFLP